MAKFLVMIANATLVDQIVDSTEGEHAEGSKVFAFGEVTDTTDAAIADALEAIHTEYDDLGAGDAYVDADPDNTGVEEEIEEEEEEEEEEEDDGDGDDDE